MKSPNVSTVDNNTKKTVKRENKEDILKRFRRIEGQIQGISRMIEGDRYCPDILTQINAAKSALESTAMILIEDHARNCIVSDIKKGKSEVAISELIKILKGFNKI
mgnify:CR=1 FL=1